MLWCGASWADCGFGYIGGLGMRGRLAAREGGWLVGW